MTLMMRSKMLVVAQASHTVLNAYTFAVGHNPLDGSRCSSMTEPLAPLITGNVPSSLMCVAAHEEKRYNRFLNSCSPSAPRTGSAFKKCAVQPALQVSSDLKACNLEAGNRTVLRKSCAADQHQAGSYYPFRFGIEAN